MNSLSKRIRQILKFIGWAISSFLFVVVIGCVVSRSLVAITMLIWLLIVLPPVYKFTKNYGKIWNVVGRLVAFLLSMVIAVGVSPTTPATQQVQSPQSKSPDVMAASPSPSPVAITSPNVLSSPSPSPSPTPVAIASSPFTPSPSPSALPSVSESERFPEQIALGITKKYFDACRNGIREKLVSGIDFTFDKVKEKYGYHGLFSGIEFAETLCRVAKSQDGFSSEVQAKQAGADILLKVGEAYKRDEIFRELIKR